MPLPVDLRKKIVDFLISLPNVNDSSGRKALVYKAGLDANLQSLIEFSEPPGQFFELLVPRLIKFGQLDDGRNALEAVLKAAKDFVGRDRREYCDNLIKQLADPNVKKYPSSSDIRLCVQLLLDGDVQDFTETKRQDLTTAIVDILGIEGESVRILHVTPARSFHLIIELPIEFALELFALFKTKSKKIVQLEKQFSVKGINIAEGKDLPVKKIIEEGVDAIKIKPLLSEVINIGIEGIWSERRIWQKGGRLDQWYKWVCNANQVSIASNTFSNNWLNEVEFRESKDDRRGFFESIKQGAHVRLLIYDPYSEALHLRARVEANNKKSDDRSLIEMRNEILNSLRKLLEMKEIKDYLGENLKIRLTHEFPLYAQLICADDRMLVAHYLSGKGGSDSPTMQLRGPDSSYFTTYKEEFEIMWERGREITYEEIEKLIDRYEGPPALSDVDKRKYNRILRQLYELQDQWDLLYKTESQLRRDKIFETRTEEKIRLEKLIDKNQTDRKKVEQELKNLEAQLKKLIQDSEDDFVD